MTVEEEQIKALNGKSLICFGCERTRGADTPYSSCLDAPGMYKKCQDEGRDILACESVDTNLGTLRYVPRRKK
jgi:hypothetical protein